MPYRLVGTVDGQLMVFQLAEGTSALGSGNDCRLFVPHATVSRKHAELEVNGERVVVRDRGSRNGTWVDNQRVASRELLPGDRIAFGKVILSLEQVCPQDVALGFEFRNASKQDPAPDPETTAELRAADFLILNTVPELLRRLEADGDELAIAQAAAGAAFAHLPARNVRVVTIDNPGTCLFEAQREITSAHEMPGLQARGAQLLLTIELPHDKLVTILRPIAEAVGSMMRLAHRRAAIDAPAATQPPPLPDPPTVCPSMLRIFQDAAQVARGDVGVLICGESGTGKEVLAGYLHGASQRAGGPFVAINCAALPENLLEAELFGIERGVATGVERRAGKFELAHQGTLFLDEIGDMPTSMQAKILRVLQEGEVYRLGGSTPRPARCRIIAATNRDIDRLREEGAFREDLYFRIATWVVELPPLRHRGDDIANLAAHFLWSEARQRGIRIKGITQAALERLTAYHWPGNIRQLKNEMARAALFLADGDALDSSRLSPELLQGAPAQPGTPIEERLARFERNEIEKTLHRTGGNASAAAAELGIGRSTLYRRMRALGIQQGGRND